MDTNPVLIIVGGAGTVVMAVLGLVTAFATSLSAGQTSAVMALVGTVSTIVLAIITRSKVTPYPGGRDTGAKAT